MYVCACIIRDVLVQVTYIQYSAAQRHHGIHRGDWLGGRLAVQRCSVSPVSLDWVNHVNCLITRQPHVSNFTYLVFFSSELLRRWL